jgi:hypothetical protein
MPLEEPDHTHSHEPAPKPTNGAPEELEKNGNHADEHGAGGIHLFLVD